MLNKRRLYTSAVLCAMLVSQVSLGANRNTAALEFIAGVESRLTLPPGSHKLHEYIRHYKFYGTHANSKVEAVFVVGEGSGGVKLVGKDALPRILDGGCNVVNVVLTRAGKIVSVQCNGRA